MRCLGSSQEDCMSFKTAKLLVKGSAKPSADASFSGVSIHAAWLSSTL